MVTEARGRDMVTQLAIARMAVGVAGFLAPKRVGRAWIGNEGASPLVAVVTRAFAVRDFALGLGTYLRCSGGRRCEGGSRRACSPTRPTSSPPCGARSR